MIPLHYATTPPTPPKNFNYRINTPIGDRQVCCPTECSYAYNQALEVDGVPRARAKLRITLVLVALDMIMDIEVQEYRVFWVALV